jgi:23S rRNA (guanosine2251-2'-O)-methyltransferase
MYVFGKNVVKELINNNKKINKAIINRDFNDKELLLLLQSKNIEIKNVDKNELDRIANGNHQGIIVDIDEYKYYSFEELLEKIVKENPIILILDHLEDPHNLGAIIRTAEAAGVDGIIIPKDRSVDVNGTVMKTSAGALEYIPICMVPNLNNAMLSLKKKGYWIVGTDIENSVDYKTVDYNMPIGLVVGSEGNGMSNIVKKACDYIVKIPMHGKVNSLNASVAAGIMIYEVIRNRGK